MTLAERLEQDMKQTMREQNKFKLSVIRMVRSSVKNAEIDNKGALDDSQVLEIITRELKQRKDSMQEFEKAGRTDLSDKLKEEIEIISAYQPAQLSAEEVAAIVDETIAEVGASSKADMGKVMGALMPKVKGRADGKLVNQLVQSKLG